jgi:cation/acetate symporter
LNLAASPGPEGATWQDRQVGRRLDRVFLGYLVGFAVFLGLLAMLEQSGVSRSVIGIVFLLAPVVLYAGIGIVSRTNDADEYYVAGRRVPAFYNGMATGADWMSAASFLGLAGTLYLTGYGGLAFVLGWTGGFCLVALFLAPYLRRFGRFTIPDFLGARYGGHAARGVGIAIAILCSFTYVVAQIYGIGLITTRLSGLAFEIGIFVGLGGVLVCSFLGGMRAVTWTQVAQYAILIIAYMIPVVWLSVKQTGSPVPQLTYGYQLQQVTDAEQRLLADPKEREVIEHFRRQAEAYRRKLADVPGALRAEREAAARQMEQLKLADAPVADLEAAERVLEALPADEKAARQAWTRAYDQARSRAQALAGMPRHTAQFAGDPVGAEDADARQTSEEARRNFLALVFCLTVGTAGLPHILTRYYTTPSVRQARKSVLWSLVFIFALYCTAPALAVLVKYEVFSVLVGAPFDQLPAWINAWSRVDPGLLSVADVNGDGVVQLGEIRIGGDIIVLAMPEMAGLPFVITGLVAAGGLAAALSTADGLLLTIANALSHDTYYKMVDPKAPTSRRVLISKMILLFVAVLAALVAAQKPADILFLVSAAFSLAAAGLFPALVLGIFWKRATKWGAVLGMLCGVGVTFYYMATTQPWLREIFGVNSPLSEHIWWGIQPISAGVFGVPLGFAVIVTVSLLTPAPGPVGHALVDGLRFPGRSTGRGAREDA